MKPENKALRKLAKKALKSSEVCQQWKDDILKAVPSLKEESKFKVNKWYRDEDGDVFYVTNWLNTSKRSSKGYGFCRGEWTTRTSCQSNYAFRNGFRLATDQEVEQALIKEAKKRGYNGNNAECLTASTRIVGKNYYYDWCVSDGLIIRERGNDSKCNCVFKDGKWAEIIETPLPKTLQKAVDKLGKEEILKLLS